MKKPDSFGTIKEGAKWSKNPGPAAGWQLMVMKDNPNKFKFIDSTGLNIIADLESEAQAKALQDYFKVNVFPPKIDGGTVGPDTKDIPPIQTTQEQLKEILHTQSRERSMLPHRGVQQSDIMLLVHQTTGPLKKMLLILNQGITWQW